MMWIVILHLVILANIHVSAFHSWSLLATINIDDADVPYGESGGMIAGRGFMTMETGYSNSTPALYIHTSDDGLDLIGTHTWSLQQVLYPDPMPESTDEFGKVVVSFNQTIIASAPLMDVGDKPEAGSVYIFNGTRRHWSQLQVLVAPPASLFEGGHFGRSMSFRENTLLIGAPGSNYELGAAFLFQRPYEGGLFEFVEELTPSTIQSYAAYPLTHLSELEAGASEVNIIKIEGSMFAETVTLYDSFVSVSARHAYGMEIDPVAAGDAIFDKDYERIGSIYMFELSSTVGRWSQQQQLFAEEFEHVRSWNERDYYAYNKFFPNDLALSTDTLAVAVRRTDTAERAQKSIQTYEPAVSELGTSRWSVQQRLILDCCVEDSAGYNVSKILVDGAKLHIGDDLDTLFVTLLSPTNHSEFIYQSDGYENGHKTWSLQQILQANVPWDSSQPDPPRFRSPSQFGGTLLMASNNRTVEVLSQYHNGSCLLLWMSDHFGDSWDTLVLTVRAPDSTNDSFSPKCDQVDPFLVRYCPYKPSDEGVYIVKPYAAQKARFFWEISWSVQVESTGEIYKGDADTKMMFDFSSTTLEFSFVEILNEKVIVPSSNAGTLDVQPCFRCGAITTTSWAELQDTSVTSFWPFNAVGAPYYISDIAGRTLFFSGRVCDGVMKYECYQTLRNGQYLMRMGGGHFGRKLNFPVEGANWWGCGSNGTWREQLIFEVADRKCTPMQKFEYNTTCDIPPPVPGGWEDAAFGSVVLDTDGEESSRRRRLQHEEEQDTFLF